MSGNSQIERDQRAPSGRQTIVPGDEFSVAGAHDDDAITGKRDLVRCPWATT